MLFRKSIRRSINRSSISINISKKASMDLSINAVVILILALVLLGVGVAFIRGTFGGLIGQVQLVGDEIGEQRLNQLRACKQEICFAQQRITIRQSQARVPFSIYNNENQKNDFDLKFKCDSVLGAQIGDPTNFATFSTPSAKGLDSGVTRLLDFDIQLPSDAPTGIILYCTLTLNKGSDVYAEDRFEIAYNKQ